MDQTDLRSRHSGRAPLSRTRQCERQPLGGPKSLVWVRGGKTLTEYMFSELAQVADIVRTAVCLRPQLGGKAERAGTSTRSGLPGSVPRVPRRCARQ